MAENREPAAPCVVSWRHAHVARKRRDAPRFAELPPASREESTTGMVGRRREHVMLRRASIHNAASAVEILTGARNRRTERARVLRTSIMARRAGRGAPF